MKKNYVSEAEKQLIALEKEIKQFVTKLSKVVREISPEARHAVKDMPAGSSSTPGRAKRRVAQDALKFVSEFSVETVAIGKWVFRAPEGVDGSKVWPKVKSIMADNHATWQTKYQGFVTDRDPQAFILGLKSGKIVRDKQDRQAFLTPDRVAKEVMSWAEVHGKAVLEPSAGLGALADACREEGAASVVCAEIDQHSADVLSDKGYTVHVGDFLSMPAVKAYHRVVMNPPFTKKAYIKHIKHAIKFVKPGGRLVSIIPGDTLPDDFKHDPDFEDHVIHRLPDKSFAASGTGVVTSILTVYVYV